MNHACCPPLYMKISRADDRWRLLGFETVVHECLERLAFQQGYRVGGVCEELGISEAHLRVLFLRDVGLSPKDWMRWERMVVARRMLLWGADVMVVAEKLGFSHANSFRREFREVHGVPPHYFLESRIPEF